MVRRRRRSDEPSTAENFGALRADYAATKASRFRRRRSGVSAAGSGADYHYRSEADYLRLMEYARDMDRNDAIIGQTVDRAVQNTIQDGFTNDPTTSDAELDKDLFDRWTDWSEDPQQCDVAGVHTFWDMETLALRSPFIDGDILALPLTAGSLQLVEAHRLRTPRNTTRNCVHGILLDDLRRPLEYWLTRDNIDPMRTVNKVSDMRRIPARDAEGHSQVFHIYTSKRVSQTRGVSALAPIMDIAGMWEDLNFATLVRAQVASCFAILRERGLDSAAGSTPATGSTETETLADGSTRTIEGIAPGMDVIGIPGETLQMASPNVPNPEFFPHAKMLLQLIGINLGLPLVLVLLDAKETNFSGWRGAVDQARMGFRQNQKRLAQRLHRPVYHWKLRQWLAEDPVLRSAEAKLGKRFYSHTWRPPTWPYIEPMKDAAADLLRVRNALTSQRRRAAERGMDWDVLSDEICEDNAKLIAKAHETAEQLNKDHDGLGITWREVASLPTPDGVKVAVTATAGDDDTPAPANNSQPPEEKPDA